MKTSEELLRNALEEWALLYGRKLADAELGVWRRIFISTDPKILVEALEIITREAERMPSPGVLTKAIRTVREKNATLAEGVRDCQCPDCGGIGYKIVPAAFDSQYNYAIKCPCHASHVLVVQPTQESRDEQDVLFRLNKWDGQKLYSARNCPEGRAFLGLLADMSQIVTVNRFRGPNPPKTTTCDDCGQNYPTPEFLSHICPSPKSREQRRLAR